MAYRRLCVEERETIMVRLGDPEVTWAQIGAELGRHRSTIQREVCRNGGRDGYSAHAAEERARSAASRTAFRFDDPVLADEISGWLKLGYSPYAAAQLSGAVCAETIYQGIYRGRLEVEPTQTLRTRRNQRRHRHLRRPTSDGNYLGDFRPIAARPAEIESRDTVGHWEGDLIVGTRNQSAVISLTERLSRTQVTLKLPDGHSADATAERLGAWLATTEYLVLSITWDQGAEMTRWKQLEDDFGIKVYFCDRRSPWQRGSNENANRQLRFWLPHHTNLNRYSQAHLDHACMILNTSPRRLHNGATAQQIYNHHTRTTE